MSAQDVPLWLASFAGQIASLNLFSDSGGCGMDVFIDGIDEAGAEIFLRVRMVDEDGAATGYMWRVNLRDVRALTANRDLCPDAQPSSPHSPKSRE
jgi:hypothetical protein